MKLQLAIDLLSIDEAKQLLDEVGDLVDIVEIGTPLVIRSGVQAISAIKRAFPQLTVLADLKIVDAGSHEAKLGFDAGADIVTVLGVAHNKTINDALSAAIGAGGELMIDLITVADVESRARQLDTMGCHYICVHTGSDVQGQGQNPLAELARLQATLTNTRAAVAGGIKPSTLEQIVPYQPEIIVVGSFITGHDKPRQAIQELRSIMREEV